jgi:hypothetical protein
VADYFNVNIEDVKELAKELWGIQIIKNSDKI